MNSETFGEHIRRRRQALQKPIREVAGRLDIDQSVLSKIERNKLTAPPRIVAPLAEILGLEYETLQQQYWSERIYHEIKNEPFARESLARALKKLERERSGTSSVWDKDRLIDRIKDYVRNKPILKVWLFGSFVRNEAGRDSDIDLLIQFDPEEQIDLFDYIGMQQDLEDLTGRRVDLVEKGQELPAIRPIIDQEKQLIYAREAV